MLLIEAAEDPARRDSVRVTAADARYYGVRPCGPWSWADLEAQHADWQALVYKAGDRMLCGRPVWRALLTADIIAEAERRAALPNPCGDVTATAAREETPAQRATEIAVALAADDDVDADYVAAVTAPEPVDPYADDDVVEVREPEHLQQPEAPLQTTAHDWRRPDMRQHLLDSRASRPPEPPRPLPTNRPKIPRPKLGLE